MNIFRTPVILPWLYPSLIWRIKSAEKNIYLTFDDGPIPGPTEFVLDTLKTFNAHATFLCIGDNVRKHPAQFERVLREGHSVGNHTMNHLNGWRTNTHHYFDNVVQCDAQLNHHKSGYFRPPFGRISRAQIAALKDYKILMWDVLTYDYDRNLVAEKCLRGAIAASRPGSIVVFHDSLKAEKNLQYALPRYMEYFSNLGFSFKALK